MNPNRAINTTGRTPQDFTHEFKILGTWLPGWAGLQVGGVYRYQSGRPWARNATGFGPLTGVNAIFMEPRATRFTPVVKALDLRAEKAFTLPAGSRISVFLDVFNVINEGVALRVNTQSGANFAVPTQWTDPRAVRAGLSWTF
jgi:outer membrane receptor protein involved in Fe transport